MGILKDHIDIQTFDIEHVDVSNLDDILDWLPKNGVFDLNIAEQGLIRTLQAENTCQEYIAKIDKLIGLKENEKSKAWAEAALNKARLAGHKTAKDKEWFAAADDTYINVVNEITVIRAAKRWFESKADYFRNWHYAFKTFLKRDYSLEKLGNISDLGYNQEVMESHHHSSVKDDFGGEVDWKD